MANFQSQMLPSLRCVLAPLSRPNSASPSTAFAFLSQRLSHPLIPVLSLSIPAVAQLHIPSWIAGLWDSVLRAVPKKKTSHSKSRHRQMAGKALKDVTALNKCSACGHVKRAHVLCPYCVHEIRDMWRRSRDGQARQAEAK